MHWKHVYNISNRVYSPPLSIRKTLFKIYNSSAFYPIHEGEIAEKSYLLTSN
ncbi:MAG: hypothetical protein PHU27_05475 [Salinivirgaceae bacterium]|nr:hypothetical protein [Salinivirgaceae bacterium]